MPQVQHDDLAMRRQQLIQQLNDNEETLTTRPMLAKLYVDHFHSYTTLTRDDVQELLIAEHVGMYLQPEMILREWYRQLLLHDPAYQIVRQLPILHVPTENDVAAAINRHTEALKVLAGGVLRQMTSKIEGITDEIYEASVAIFIQKMQALTMTEVLGCWMLCQAYGVDPFTGQDDGPAN